MADTLCFFATTMPSSTRHGHLETSTWSSACQVDRPTPS